MNQAERNLRWATALIDSLVLRGVDYLFLAPGSRNSPLTIAVARHPAVSCKGSGARNVAQASCLGPSQGPAATEDPGRMPVPLNESGAASSRPHAGPGCTVHYDERALAFQALGFARATGRPAAVITTSGSAVANLLPGVVEASQTNTPMLLLTADRPASLRGTGANQTIDQVGIFGSYARWSVDLAPSDVPEAAREAVDQALVRATGHPAGPVHLNLMFPEPLVPEPQFDGEGAEVARARAAETGVPGTSSGERLDGVRRRLRPPATHQRPGEPASSESMSEALDRLADGKRALIVAGCLPSFDATHAVQTLADRVGWPLLPDITSGLRLGPGVPNRVAYFDALLQEETLAEPADTVLHLGGPFVSKRLSGYLAASRPDVVVQVSGPYGRVDPDGIVTLSVPGDIEAFCAAATPHLSGDGVGDDWLGGWTEKDAASERAVSSYLARGSELSEPWVARRISELLPQGHALVLGNSMPVRDMNAFATPSGHPARVLANRGASGIDGTLATATGFARGTGTPATVVLGDLALLHDLTSLHLVAGSGEPLVLVVVNNNGGGIFHFLPIARHGDVFEAFFGTPHGLRFESATRQFGVGYARADTREAFDTAYRGAVEQGASILIEVTTDRQENVRVHERLLGEVRTYVGGANV